jgi:ATP synthase protein I
MTQGVQRDQGRSAPDNAAMDQGMRVLSYLISGVIFYGALGWVGDHFLHTSFLLPIGIIVGAGLGIYLTIKRLQANELTQPSNDVITNVTEGER